MIAQIRTQSPRLSSKALKYVGGFLLLAHHLCALVVGSLPIAAASTPQTDSIAQIASEIRSIGPRQTPKSQPLPPRGVNEAHNAMNPRQAESPLRVGIIVQARTQSTRLPGKALKCIGGQSLLAHHLHRLSVSSLPIAVATSTLPQDDPIVQIALELGCSVFRGSEGDVLDRVYQTAVQEDFDVIVRTTADCPLIDGTLIGDSARIYLERNDPQLYLTPCQQRTFPRGLDFEIFSINMLAKAHKVALRPIDREHVTPSFYHPPNGEIHIAHVLSDQPMQDWRLCVDTLEDFELLRQLIEDHGAQHLYGQRFLELLQRLIHLRSINSNVRQRSLE